MVMQKLTTFRTIAALLLIATFAIIISCQNSTTPIIVTHNENNAYGNISGKVLNSTNAPFNGVEVSVGTNKVYTNSKGEFFLTKVPIGSKVLVNFKLDGYTSTQKITEVKNSRTSQLEATLLPIVSVNLNAANGGTLDINGAKVTFPVASLVDSKGNPFTGTAQVKARYFDPTSTTFVGCFPGDFKGIRTDLSETPIESFGFINVEIWNGTEKLQIASGKQASISFPIPASIQSKAPATIPLWYYDDTKGSWLEEGTAIKNGNNYVGSVKHFSSWNCDQPTQTSYLQGKVIDKNGDPISFAKVRSLGVDYTGQSSVYTGDDGTFKIAVKSTSTAKIWASYYIFESTKQDIATPATGNVQDIGNITIPVDTMNMCTIIGRVIDNGNLPVTYANVNLIDSNNKVIDHIIVNKEGKFKFFGELGTKYKVEAVSQTYQDSLAIKTSVTFTTSNNVETKDLGDLKLDVGGSTIIGRVVDSLNAPIFGVYFYSTESGGNTGSDKSYTTDSTGRFSVWVRPDKDIKITFYNRKQTSKVITVHSGALGETKDIGDVVVP